MSTEHSKLAARAVLAAVVLLIVVLVVIKVDHDRQLPAWCQQEPWKSTDLDCQR